MQAHPHQQKHKESSKVELDAHILVVHASLCCHGFSHRAGRQQRSAEAGQHCESPYQDTTRLFQLSIRLVRVVLDPQWWGQRCFADLSISEVVNAPTLHAFSSPRQG